MKRLFWFINSLCQDPFGVSTRKANGKVASIPTQKANKCNAHFQFVFNPCSSLDKTPQASDPPLPYMPDIIIITPGTEKLLHNLNPSNRTGPDEIPTRLLKECIVKLSPVTAALYQQWPRWRRSTGGLEISECPPHLQEGLQVWTSQLPPGGPDSDTMQAAGALNILLPPLASGRAKLDQALPT